MKDRMSWAMAFGPAIEAINRMDMMQSYATKACRILVSFDEVGQLFSDADPGVYYSLRRALGLIPGLNFSMAAPCAHPNN